MPPSFFVTAAAAMAYLPAAALLYLVLDRYAAPRVPRNLFDDRKVILAIIVGLFLGLPPGVVLTLYLSSLATGDVFGAVLYLVLFLLATALLRRVVVRLKTFGGRTSKDPQVAVNTFAFGTMSGASMALGLSFWQLEIPQPSTVLLVLLGISLDVVFLEGWAGLRFGREMRRGFSWVPPLSVLGGEALGVLALSTLLFQPATIGYVGLAALFLGAVWALLKEEPRTFRALRRAAGLEGEGAGRKFGRGAVASTEGAEGTGEVATGTAAGEAPTKPSEAAASTGESPSQGPPSP